MERFDTLDQYHAWYEHWHRYHWVSPFLETKTVADIACGEGYGSALISQTAQHVTAVDIDAGVIAQATKKYSKLHNLNFQIASALQTNIRSQSIDSVVSFETLEHLEEHQALFLEFKRLLKPDGVLIISTPDKLVYSGDGNHNEFHVKELTANEFEMLVKQYFKHVIFFGQDMQMVSCISPKKDQNAELADLKYIQKNNEFKDAEKKSKPTYLIAIASDNASELMPFQQEKHSVFNDVNNELFAHYEKQISTLLATDKQLLYANKQLHALEQQLKQQRLIVSELQARLGL